MNGFLAKRVIGELATVPEGMTGEDIAQRLGMPVKRARNMLGKLAMYGHVQKVRAFDPRAGLPSLYRAKGPADAG